MNDRILRALHANVVTLFTPPCAFRSLIADHLLIGKDNAEAIWHMGITALHVPIHPSASDAIEPPQGTYEDSSLLRDTQMKPIGELLRIE
eukprot:CAMPEP_0198133344 /NCGR_PEP_ID=MMETSP1442-20131203/59519_1 /TAXON_ID= /ORGANISM="Craspedostauros australis, Strain CCMP3328" /LENGTH=89 /DNA_ID=CAMNT_0043794461 /DNA_START=503 /DNA_END=771 /DNA_ORIENTATION=-